MVLSLRRWEEIQQWFSKEEADEMSRAITGESICPKGAVIDGEKLNPALREKVEMHLGRTLRQGAAS
jgi:hypothetical protein